MMCFMCVRMPKKELSYYEITVINRCHRFDILPIENPKLRNFIEFEKFKPIDKPRAAIQNDKFSKILLYF